MTEQAVVGAIGAGVDDSSTDRTVERVRRVGVLRAIWASPTGRIGLIVIVIMLAAALVSPWLAPHDPIAQRLPNALKPPVFASGSWSHPLGTDEYGRDILSRIMYGGRVSFFVGLVASTISAFLGAAMGLIAGWFEGRVGAIIMRFADVQFAMPFLVILLAIVAIYGPGLWKIMIVMSFWGWATHARTISSSVSQTKRLDYISSGRLIGASIPRLIVRHVFPNVRSSTIILWSASAGTLILAEAGLSLLGLGVQSPGFSWGSMLSTSQQYLGTAWWLAVMPGVAISITMISFAMVGDAVRDAFGENPASKDPPELT